MPLSSSLKALGFSSLSRSIFWCRAGELIHAVVVSRDRHGDTAISPVVWHSSMMSDNEEFRPSSIQSPVSGNVSPSGVDSSWTWKAADLDPAFVVSVLKQFFSRFATMEDVRRCLDGMFVTPYFQERLAEGVSRADVNALVSSSAKYEISGGAFDRVSAQILAKEFLAKTMSPLGFSLANVEDVVVIRKRGEMFDCVRLVLDQFATFGTVTCFPWAASVWKVDKRWRGTFYPMLRRDVHVDGRQLLIDLLQLQQVDVSDLRLRIEQSLEGVTSVIDARDFAERLDPQWSTVANALRRLP